MARLKYTIDDPVEVIGPLRDFYVRAEDGKFHLSVDGDSPKLKDFRENNRNLHTQKTELEARLAAFEGIDPAEYKVLKERPDVSPRIAELESTLAAEREAHAVSALRSLVTYEFLRAGGRESAVDFTMMNAQKVFRMVDGKPTTELFSPANPGVPLTVAEWVESQVPVHPYTFQGSRGGGARPSQSPGSRSVVSRDPLTVGQNLVDIASGKVTVE